jgi:hypothetical protein
LKDPSENNELTMTSKSIDLSFQDLIPVPVTKRTKEGTTRKRKVTHSSVLTDSPYKNELEASADKKKGKSVPIKGLVPKTKTKSITEEDAECVFCGELYSETGGHWIRCISCQKWAHEDCAGTTKKCKVYICEVIWNARKKK